jgi:hypothetical protein
MIANCGQIEWISYLFPPLKNLNEGGRLAGFVCSGGSFGKKEIVESLRIKSFQCPYYWLSSMKLLQLISLLKCFDNWAG